MLLDFIDRCGLIVVNRDYIDQRQATFRQPNKDNGYSHVDLTLLNKKAYNNLVNWKILDDAVVSDHRAIQFEIREA